MSTESPPPTILVVDDDADIVQAARLVLERRAMRVLSAASPEAAWPVLADTAVDVILLDLNFARGRTSGEEGFAMLDRLIAADRDAVVVVITGHSGINIAVQAMRAGASDFLIKPWSNERLLATVERATALRRARAEMAPAPAEPADDRLILGEHGAIVRARETIARIAPTDAAVLIHGPAGSGKSLTARAIHHASPRAERPLATLACATADDADAVARAVEEAGNGTLIIDSIEALAAPLQPLLHQQLGPARSIATSRVDRGELRRLLDADLLYRVNTVEIALPPLSTRESDVLRLARHFLDLFAARYGKPARPLSDEAARAIAIDRWPDDVRGLRQAMERAVLLGTGSEHGLADFALAAEPDDIAPRAVAADLNLAKSERTLVEAALKRNAFNVSRAAAELGLTRAALYRRMAKYGL